MIKKYNVGIIELTTYSNGFPKGFIIKREPTVRETMYILQEILDFANDDYKDWFGDEIEVEGYQEQCQFILTEFLKGDCDWSCLCNETQCYYYDEMGFPIASVFPLVCYLKDKGII